MNLKKLISIMLALVLAISALPISAMASGTAKPNLNGEGYYEISTAAELYWFADSVNSGKYNLNAVLTDNITVNQKVLDENGNLNGDGQDLAVWTPIGNGENHYSGTFDGQEHTISGLYFADDSVSYVGMFGYISGTVKNVIVQDSYFVGEMTVGGVAGENYGTLKNCRSAATVFASYWSAGGVCGENYRLIEDCSNSGKVSGESWGVGGVCGQNSGGTIIRCSNSGAISSDRGAGGVCGYHIDLGLMTDCYNTGTVSGSFTIGGVCGNFGAENTLERCYNAGTIIGETYVGGVAGLSQHDLKDCYNIGDISGTQYVGGVSGKHQSRTMENCYNIGSVSGDSEVGSVCGENEGVIKNCYYLDSQESDSIDGTTYKTAEQFASGDVCELLNGNREDKVWGQVIGKDASPTLSGEIVKPSYSAATDAKAYTVDEIITLTAVLGRDVSGIALFNENGKRIVAQSMAESDNADGTKTFTATFTMGTKGERKVYVSAYDSQGQLNDTGLFVEFTVDTFKPGSDDPIQVLSVSAVKKAKRNEVIMLTVKTSMSASKVGIFSETGAALGKVSQSYVDKNGERVWTIAIKIGSKGNRTFGVKATDYTGVWSNKKSFKVAIV